jgi:hypothetical protein
MKTIIMNVKNGGTWNETMVVYFAYILRVREEMKIMVRIGCSLSGTEPKSQGLLHVTFTLTF